MDVEDLFEFKLTLGRGHAIKELEDLQTGLIFVLQNYHFIFQGKVPRSEKKPSQEKCL